MIETKLKIALAATVLLSFNYFCPVSLADDQTSAAAASPTSTPNPSSPATLQGQVQKTAKDAASGIKSVGEAASKLKRAASELFGECSRHDTQIMDEPEMIAGTIIEIPISFDLGPCLPPRKKWVDTYMSQIEQFQSVLQEELDGVLIPADKAADVNPLMSNMNIIMQDVQSRINDLKQLAQTPPYPANSMGQQCKLISDDMKQIDELHKKVYHLIRKGYW